MFWESLILCWCWNFSSAKSLWIMCLGIYAESRRHSFAVVLGRGVLESVCSAVWKALRCLTGCEFRDWKKLPSPGCQVWFSRDKEGLKLPPSFWWWVKSKSVISAYFLPVCLPGSPFASAVSDTNRVLCPKLPAQGNRGNGTVNLEVPWPC